VGILAGAGTVAATAGTATSLISAGTSAGITEGAYMAQNTDSFETTPFLFNSGISGTTGYLNGNPALSGMQKIGVSLREQKPLILQMHLTRPYRELYLPLWALWRRGAYPNLVEC